MRLSWLVLAFAVIAVSRAGNAVESSSTDATTVAQSTTTEEVDPGVQTTNSGATDGSTTPGEPGPVVTDGTSGSPGPTDEPKTGAPETTDDANTDNTPKPTEKPTVVPVTVKTTLKGSTTTKEPQPDVESFTVKCDKTSLICTYSMQVPGLDIATFDRLMGEVNDTEVLVNNYESTDLVNLQDGVTKVFDDAQVTAAYVKSQLDQITVAIADLDSLYNQLKGDYDTINTDVQIANNSLTKIMNKKGSCLYRQCVLKETTTPKPVTTTTVRTTPTPFCAIEKNQGICQHNGTCTNYYDSYYCTCVGNLDGQDFNCNSSVCDVIKDAQEPGPIYSPGYNGTHFSEEECDGAQWTVKAKDDKNNVLALVEEEFPKNSDFIGQLSADANLQLTVNKYKLKITSKTKIAQITQILEYGPQATISYSGTEKDYFHFTLTEKTKPPPSP